MFPLFLCILWQFRATKGSVGWVLAAVAGGSSENVELCRGSEPREPGREALSPRGQGRGGRKGSLMSSQCVRMSGDGLPRGQDQCVLRPKVGNLYFGNSWSVGLGPGWGEGEGRACEAGTEGLGGRPRGRALGWVSPVLAAMGIPKHQLLQAGAGSAVQVPVPGTEPRPQQAPRPC